MGRPRKSTTTESGDGAIHVLPARPNEVVGQSGLSRSAIARKAWLASIDSIQRPLLTDEQVKMLLDMAEVGVVRQQLAKLFRCSTEWLATHYGDELDAVEVYAVSNVARTLYVRATTGRDLGAAIFYLKARGNWRENNDVSSGAPNTDNAGSLQRLSGLLDKWADNQRGKNGKEAIDAPSDSTTGEAETARTDGTSLPTH